jgi:hypothetical protein
MAESSGEVAPNTGPARQQNFGFMAESSGEVAPNTGPARQQTFGFMDEAPSNVAGSKSPTEVARELGKAGEKSAGIAQNTQRIESLSGKAAYRTPDELTPTTLTEVKNVAYQHFSTQLQDSLHYAMMTGRQMILKVRPDTVLSKQLQDAIKAGWIKLEFLP